MKDDNLFVCPKCGSEFKKNSHYKSMINMQNLIADLTDGKKIKSMCMKCDYKEYSNENN